MSIGSVIGMLAGSYLPGSNHTLNSMVGMMIGGIAESGFSKLNCVNGSKLKELIGIYENTLIVNKFTDSSDKLNPMYVKIEKYIMSKYTHMIHQCTIQPNNGEINLNTSNIKFIKNIKEIFTIDNFVHEITFEFVNKSEKGNQPNEIMKETKYILIKSKKSSLVIIKEILERVCCFKKDPHILEIYRAITKNSKKSENNFGSGNISGEAYWNSVISLNNKRISNTILNEKNEKELYSDIKWFMNSKDYYNFHGIPYKRGYLLHGLPGTGKTSIIKAIANEYQLPIFTIQMNIIKCDSQFITLMSEISEYIGNKSYILALEDIDRSDLFKYNKWGEFMGKHHVSLGTILNELDGVCEAHGRLLFVTANSYECLQKPPNIEALFRPGRIDVTVELGNCDLKQLARIIIPYINKDSFIDEINKNDSMIENIDNNLGNFVNVDNNISGIVEMISSKLKPELNNMITPSKIMEILQKNVDNPEYILSYIFKPEFLPNGMGITSQSTLVNPLVSTLGLTSKPLDPKHELAFNRYKLRLRNKTRLIRSIDKEIKYIEKNYTNLEKLNKRKERLLKQKQNMMNKEKTRKQKLKQ
jgi:chaperone BCS1